MARKRGTLSLRWTAAFCLLVSGAAMSYGQASTMKEAYKDVEVEGRAAIMNGDMDRARQAARADALRHAVEQVLGVYVSSDTLVRNFETVRDEITARADGYASIEHILSEGAQGDIYTLRARVRVFLVDDKDDKGRSWQGLLQDLHRRGELRSKQIAVIFPQGSELVEEKIREALIQAKFKVVDPVRVHKLREDRVIQQLLRGETDLARLHELSKQSIADIIITGRVSITPRGALGRIGVYDIRLSYQAILLDTAEIVAESAVDARGVQALDARIALQKGLEWSTPELTSSVSRNLVLGVFGNIIARVNVEVGGFERFSDCDMFENALLRVLGVQRVYRQSFAGGLLTLEVEVERAHRQRLAGAIESLELQGFRVQVRTATPSRIEAQAVYQAASASSAESVETPEKKSAKPAPPKTEPPAKPVKSKIASSSKSV